MQTRQLAWAHFALARCLVSKGRGSYSFTAPAEAFMIRFWKMKNTMAMGMVMSVAAASFSGCWVLWLNCSEES